MRTTYYTIYKTTNLINGKTYIGKHQTDNLDDGYMGSGKHLKRAIAKYGIENFKKEILFIFDNEEEMNAKEAELVTEEFVAESTNYNLCPGGQGGWGYVNTVLSDKMKEIRSKNLQNVSVETRRENAYRTHKIRVYTNRNYDHNAANSANAWSPEATAKREATRKERKFQQGKNNSQFGKIWITNETENKKIKKTDPIPDGWRRGRIMKK